ncbi:MAG: GntR family transcriptional regulator [Victivallaceae bacterium]|nr:GntR family transcriptional regulator [Victivallaceae bacterium]
MNLEIIDSKLKPVYQQIKEQLEAYIRRNNLAPGTMLPTVQTIATEAGVSVRTADRGMKELIKSGICFRRPKKGTFVADQQELPINSTTKKICGVLSDNGLGMLENNIVTLSIYRGMVQEAALHDIDLVFISGKTADAAERIEFYRNSRELELCGILCIKYCEVAESIELAKLFPDLRFIDVNYYTHSFEISPDNVIGVFNDDFSGAYQAMQAMLEDDYQRVGILSIPLEDENYRNRIKGFTAAITSADGVIEHRIIRDDVFMPGDYIHTEQSGFKMMRQLISEGFDAEVIVCTNDHLAAGATHYLKKIGRTGIPICGYDNMLPGISRDNQFSTVSIDFEEMGRKAIKITQSERELCPKVIKISPLLIMRKQQKKLPRASVKIGSRALEYAYA